MPKPLELEVQAGAQKLESELAKQREEAGDRREELKSQGWAGGHGQKAVAPEMEAASVLNGSSSRQSCGSRQGRAA